MPTSLLSVACDLAWMEFTTGGDAEWFIETTETHDGEDAAQSGDIDDDEETWFQTTVEGTGIVKFWWKVSSEVGQGDEAAFYIDGAWNEGRSGNIGWYQVIEPITTTGTHTLRWKYMKGSSGTWGSDCAWVDCVEWSGTQPDPNGWQRIEYVYDLSGRRVEKKVDGTTELKFLYDGDQIIAEYDANDTLLRKYVHGPCMDEPICLIESGGTYAGTQYYHYDALGSVVAMTDPNGDVVQLYEYSVYGQVAASDANHPNRFMFTGREFDKDTGLYYYRARYYHPEIGRFLQTDPIGYGDGMNWYRYCANCPVSHVDPSGCEEYPEYWTFSFEFPTDVVGDAAAVKTSTMWELTLRYFGSTGFYRECPGWQLLGVDWGEEDKNVSGEDRHLIKATFGYAKTGVPGETSPWSPVLSFHYATARAGVDGKGEERGRFPYVVVASPRGIGSPTVALLSIRTLYNIIRPQIQAINAFPKNSLVRELYLWPWDSFFKGMNNCQWSVEALGYRMYLGCEINYIVAGHLFAHLGFPIDQAEQFVLGWKNTSRVIETRYGPWRGWVDYDDPAMRGTWDWLYVGYTNSGRFETWGQ